MTLKLQLFCWAKPCVYQLIWWTSHLQSFNQTNWLAWFGSPTSLRTLSSLHEESASRTFNKPLGADLGSAAKICPSLADGIIQSHRILKCTKSQNHCVYKMTGFAKSYGPSPHLDHCGLVFVAPVFARMKSGTSRSGKEDINKIVPIVGCGYDVC